MKPLRIAIILAAATQLAGCFFVFLPGSVTSAVADSVTGAEGQHCVAPNKKVGDVYHYPDGRRATIKSLSGTSVRCTDPARPIRALLVFE